MKKIIIFFCGCLIFAPLFLICSYYSLPLASPSLQNYYILKDHINQNVPKHKKRLVIMSASDGMFGIVGEMIDKETEYYPINYSMFFGTGLDLEFRINKLIASLQNGDTLLLPLNFSFYSTQRNPDYFSYYQNMLSWGDKGFLYNHPILTLKTLLKSPPSQIPTGFIKHIVAYLRSQDLANKKEKKWREGGENFNGINISSLDRYGELRYHQGTLLKPKTAYSYLNEDFKISDYFLKNYKKLIDFCMKNNIKIIVAYPPILENPSFDLNKPYFMQIVKNFQKELLINKIQIQGDPQNFQFPLQDFYDSPYHLNTQGAIKYTNELIKILKLNSSGLPNPQDS